MDAQQIALPLLWIKGDIELPGSARQLEIVEINVALASELNKLWHSRLPLYRTGFCLYATICFAAIFKNVYYATAIWSNPVARNLPQHEWLELRRLAISPDAPKYTATRMLSKMQKTISNKFPEITTLVSYQDMDVHKGTIYKAGNWTPDGTWKGGSWSRPNLKWASGNPMTRPDANKATGPKQRWIYRLRGPA